MTELESLKEIATNKGISFPQNITVAKLKEKIAAFDEGFSKTGSDSEETETITPNMSVQARRNAQRKEQEKLVRVIITCMNPQKSQWHGQYFSVGNALIPHQTKFLQFGREYHITKFMYDVIKEATYRTSREVPDGKGGKTRENLTKKEFGIEVLPALTEQELKELRLEQAARKGKEA